MVVDVATNGTNFTASTPRELFSLLWPSAIATIAADGSCQWTAAGSRCHFQPPARLPHTYVVINWETLLKR